MESISHRIYRSATVLMHNDHFDFQTLFTRALSRRVRHIRHMHKKKSMPPPDPSAKTNADSTDPTPRETSQQERKKRKTTRETASSGTISSEEYQKHLAELATEMSKSKPSAKHIETLLDAIHHNNQRWIATLGDGELTSILKVVPCYEDGVYVSKLTPSHSNACANVEDVPLGNVLELCDHQTYNLNLAVEFWANLLHDITSV